MTEAILSPLHDSGFRFGAANPGVCPEDRESRLKGGCGHDCPPHRVSVVVVLWLFAAGSLSQAVIIDRIAVSVGNSVITTSDIDREIRVAAFQSGDKPDFSPANRKATAERLIDQKLIRRELENARYPVPPEAEILPVLEQFKKKYYKDDAAFQRALSEDGITEQDLKNELLWERALSSFIDVRFRPGVQVTDQEIQDYFNKNVLPGAQAASPGQTISVDAYRDQIEEKLTANRVDEAVNQWLAAVRKRTEIIYHPEVFQ